MIVITGCIILEKTYAESLFSNVLLYFGLCFICNSIFKKSKGSTIITTLIAFALSYILFGVAVIITFGIESFIRCRNKIAILIIISCIHVFLISRFFKINRFKNGFSFLQENFKNEYLDITIFSISCMILYLYSFITFDGKINYNGEIVYNAQNMTWHMIVTFFLFGIILVLTISQTLKTSYKYHLLENTIKDYEKTIKEKDEKILRLSDEKFNINKLNHEFYNRQKSLELKVEKALKNMNFEISNECDLGDKILELSKEYTNKVIEIKNNNELSKTDIEEIDDMFSYMQSECTKNGIEFILQINGNIHYLVNNIINKTRLVTLIGDHLKDAIIAINYSDNKYKSILAILGIKDDCYEFCIYDSGIEFEIQTFNKLGLEPATTHKESGGTGIGFITTFETLRATDASLIIEEKNKLTENKYTKSIKFKFDNKKELKIISYRANDIRANLENNRFIIEQN